MNDDNHIDTIDYAMDALDEMTRRRSDQHLERCAQCRAEVAEWREATAGLADSVMPVTPPPALRNAVLADAARTPQEGPLPGPSEESRPASTRHHVGRWLAAAAAAVVVVTGGVTVVSQPWNHTPNAVSAIERVQDAPDAQHATAPAGNGSLVMVTSATQGKAVATLRDVPAAASGKVYQAWLITASGPVSAGFLQPGKATLLQGSITGAKGAAVTIEPTGGSNQPTTKPVASVTMT